MFVSVVLDPGGIESARALASILLQYGFSKVQRSCFECATFTEKNLNTLKKDKYRGKDYNEMTEAQQHELGSYVNLMLSSTQLLVNPIMGLQPKYSDDDFDKFKVLKNKTSKNEVCVKYRALIISLSNLLYKIKLDEKDRKLLFKSFRKNKKMLSSLNMKKSDFTEEVMDAVVEALSYKDKLTAR